MRKHTFKRVLIAVGLLSVVGVVGAQTYYTHKLSERLAEEESPQITQADPGAGIRDPWAAMQADMNRMDQTMAATFGAMRNMPTIGQTDLQEQGDNYVVKVNIPGAKENDINVNLDGCILNISSSTQGSEKHTADHGGQVSQEQFSNSFQQSFRLPGAVDASKMHSQYQDGVLTITIPKRVS